MPPQHDFAPSAPNGRYTYADYLAWKHPPYVELLAGWAHVRPTPWTQHQQCLGNLAAEISAYLKAQPHLTEWAYLGPLDVRLCARSAADRQTTTVVLPDLFVVRHQQQVDELGCVSAPAWIIEIGSPSTANHDLHTKFDLYAENGVREYWVVLPGERTVATYVLEGEHYQSRGDYYEPGRIPSHTLPELPLEWADVFEHV